MYWSGEEMILYSLQNNSAVLYRTLLRYLYGTLAYVRGVDVLAKRRIECDAAAPRRRM